MLTEVRGGVYSKAMTDKQMYWATIGVMLVVGFLGGYLYRKIAPAMENIIPYSCTYGKIVYKHGEGFPATDGCNSCSCQNGQVQCTAMACDISVPQTRSGVFGLVDTVEKEGNNFFIRVREVDWLSCADPPNYDDCSNGYDLINEKPVTRYKVSDKSNGLITSYPIMDEDGYPNEYREFTIPWDVVYATFDAGVSANTALAENYNYPPVAYRGRDGVYKFDIEQGEIIRFYFQYTP